MGFTGRKFSAFLYFVLFSFSAAMSGCFFIADNGGSSGGIKNSYPVILLHGFNGWGRDEVGGPKGHYHWGGYDDLQEIIKKSGHECHTAVVGPFSSSWDRACELYAQLKGKKTDYGLYHSIANRHDRYGKDFTGKGLFNETGDDWGTTDNRKKIHIITHSFGAQTARLFAQLLENGDPDETNYAKGNSAYASDISDLFKGESGTKNLVQSITTMAGTNNGTTLADGVVKMMPFVEELVIGLTALFGSDPDRTFFNFYDFKLQQFGFTSIGPDETYKQYWDRTWPKVKLFLAGDRKDICVWDISPDGAIEMNTKVFAQKNIYYFSYADCSTHPASLPYALDNWERHELADANSCALFFITSPIMGSYTCNDARYHGPWAAKDYEFYNMPLSARVKIDSTWWDNDGVVNTISQKGPFLYPDGYAGKRDSIVDWDGVAKPAKGVWNYSGVFENVDHYDITGMEIFWYDRDNYKNPKFGKHPEDWYVKWADYLATLED
ncbi:MAG: hypothetical protein MUD12_16345 [Spirochaetes bacterium]|jgi:triacylglycerol lipase|nr:hypothetical protein [Spirochaetota bacterium]